jgi:RimJ/RimL family protein N-acetyltransferase
MKLSLTKESLLGKLPIRKSPWIIRAWTRDDLDRLAAWPKYPFPYEGFEFRFVSMDTEARDKLFVENSGKSDKLPLVVDQGYQPVIGYISLSRINWDENRVNNIGFRIHPDWVNKGVGTSMLRAVCFWSFDCGITSIGISVAASNARAIRCYEKVGFYKAKEIWRNAPDLQGVDIGNPHFDFLRLHLRRDREVPELRFYQMELIPSKRFAL